MDRARIRVDFNELVEPDLVLLSKTDIRIDSEGGVVHLRPGVQVSVYDEDFDESGQPNNLLADGVVEANSHGGWTSAARWCCRISSIGIRHERDN